MIDGEYLFRVKTAGLYIPNRREASHPKSCAWCSRRFTVPHLSVMQNLTLSPMQDGNAEKKLSRNYRNTAQKGGLLDKAKNYPSSCRAVRSSAWPSPAPWR